MRKAWGAVCNQTVCGEVEEKMREGKERQRVEKPGEQSVTDCLWGNLGKNEGQ